MNAINEIAMKLLMALSLSYSADTGLPAVNTQELICLAKNTYFESRAESMQGKMATANVVRNRVASPDFPNSYCGVIKQGPVRESWKTRKDPNLPAEKRIYIPRKHRCQFSWWCDGEKDTIWIQYMNGTHIEANMTAWRDSVNVALMILNGQTKDNTNGSLYYYAHNLVYPHWAEEFQTVKVIGNHTFMKP